MGGSIGVESLVGEGSTFSFTLSLRTSTGDPVNAASVARIEGLRALIVDDNDVRRRALHEQPALTRAGMAHLYFESVHPFEDGNGRIGRAISEKALAQGVGHPTLTALATTILIRRKAYYDALEKASKDNEITRWLIWFAGIAIEAQGGPRRGLSFDG